MPPKNLWPASFFALSVDQGLETTQHVFILPLIPEWLHIAIPRSYEFTMDKEVTTSVTQNRASSNIEEGGVATEVAIIVNDGLVMVVKQKTISYPI